MYLCTSITNDLIISNKERENIYKKKHTHFSHTGNFQSKTKLNVACGSSHTSIMVESCQEGWNMVDLEDIAKSPGSFCQNISL